MHQVDMAKYIHTTTGTITTVMDSMERHGVVKRVRGEDDRRYFKIHLTQEGKKLIAKQNKIYLDTLKKEMGIFSENELSEIIRLGSKIQLEEKICPPLARLKSKIKSGK